METLVEARIAELAHFADKLRLHTPLAQSKLSVPLKYIAKVMASIG